MMQRPANLPPDHGDHERSDRCGYFIEKFARSFCEISIVHPARMDTCPIEMLLKHFLERPGNGALLGRESTVKIDIVFFSRDATEWRSNPQ
jgi:hypothetical protein